MPNPPSFSIDEAEAFHQAWRFNCGPAALCAISGRRPEEALAAIPYFKARGYTNPKMMRAGAMAFGLALSALRSDEGAACREHGIGDAPWPDYGLVRIQWDGPWCGVGVPVPARYRHTHWIAVDGEHCFDINCMIAGGWVPRDEWTGQVAPWIIRECDPKATGWWPTHCWRVARGCLPEVKPREEPHEQNA